MELGTIRKFLRLDEEEDDEYVELLYQAAREYIVDAVGRCDEGLARVRLLILTICATLYENRLYSVEGAGDKVQYTLRSMLFQLQMGGEDDGADEGESGGTKQEDSDFPGGGPGG